MTMEETSNLNDRERWLNSMIGRESKEWRWGRWWQIESFMTYQKLIFFVHLCLVQYVGITMGLPRGLASPDKSQKIDILKSKFPVFKTPGFFCFVFVFYSVKKKKPLGVVRSQVITSSLSALSFITSWEVPQEQDRWGWRCHHYYWQSWLHKKAGMCSQVYFLIPTCRRKPGCSWLPRKRRKGEWERGSVVLWDC